MEIEVHFTSIIYSCLFPTNQPASRVPLFYRGCVGSKEQAGAILHEHTGCVVGVKNQMLHDQLINSLILSVICVLILLIIRSNVRINSPIY